MSGFTNAENRLAGIVHRGEYLCPDGRGGVIHSYLDGELICHYATLEELIGALNG